MTGRAVKVSRGKAEAHLHRVGRTQELPSRQKGQSQGYWWVHTQRALPGVWGKHFCWVSISEGPLGLKQLVTGQFSVSVHAFLLFFTAKWTYTVCNMYKYLCFIQLLHFNMCRANDLMTCKSFKLIDIAFGWIIVLFDSWWCPSLLFRFCFSQVFHRFFTCPLRCPYGQDSWDFFVFVRTILQSLWDSNK